VVVQRTQANIVLKQGKDLQLKPGPHSQPAAIAKVYRSPVVYMLSTFQPLKLITSFTVSDKNESHYSTSIAIAEAFHLHRHKKKS
jgi:hypothetical protein